LEAGKREIRGAECGSVVRRSGENDWRFLIFVGSLSHCQHEAVCQFWHMASSPLDAANQTAASSFKVRPFVWFGWVVIVGLLAYFVFKTAPRYFVFTPESYGDYFWPKVSWLFPHICCGILAAVLGPLQFWPRIRRDFLPFHRISGRLYVVGVLVGAIAALGMATKIGPDDAAYGLGLMGLAIAWVVTTAMAFVAIRRRNIFQHKQWMVRSYVVTFAFVTFRLTEKLLNAGHVLSPHELASVLAWACWAIPLLIAEVALQGASVLKAH